MVVSPIDITFAISMLLGFYVGFSRGIIQTVFTVLSFVFGIMAGFKFADPMTNFLKQSFGSDSPLMFAAGFLLSFAVVMIFIRLLARTLENLLRSANINFINQIMGGILSSFFMMMIFSYMLWFAEKSHLVSKEVKQSSISYPYVKEFPGQAKIVFENIKPVVMDFWEQSADMMDELEKMGMEKTSEESIYDLPDDPSLTPEY